MNEIQDKEKKFKEEYSDLERKYNSLIWKLENTQNENKILSRQLQNYSVSEENFERISEKGGKDDRNYIFEVLTRCKGLENELEHIKLKKKNKIKLYKKKILNLEMILQQTVSEKDKKIGELEEIIKSNSRKSPLRSPLRSLKSNRRNSNSELQEISQMIVKLERSQAEYKQRYINFQKTKSGSFAEINNLYDLLKNNEKKLKEAKKLQDNLLKSN